MRLRIYVALAALVVTGFMLGAVGAASARNIRFLNSERGFRWAWTEDGGSDTSGVSISCEVSLEGSFSVSSFTKTAGTKIGDVTRAIVGIPCRRGAYIVLSETLPWEVRYQGFTGTLPNITGINVDVIDESFRLEAPLDPALNNCLYRSEVNHPERYIFNLVEAGAGLKKVETVRIDERARIPLRAPCVEEIAFQGTATATVRGETAKTSIRLI